MKDGILLVATNQAYIDESRPLVASIRHHMPDVHIHLICEQETPVEDGLFDSLNRVEFEIPEYVDSRYVGFLKRDLALNKSPFERTVHMDCDTILGAPLYEMFHALTKFEVLVAASPSRIHAYGRASKILPQKRMLPCAWVVPRINCGMISYTKSAVTKGFFTHWVDLYLEGMPAAIRTGRTNYSDQSKMRQTLWETDLSTCVMADEYNFRTGNYYTLDGPVRIAHGRPPIPRERLIDFVNSTHVRRSYLPYKGMVFTDENSKIIYRRLNKNGSNIYTDFDFNEKMFEESALITAC